MVFSKPFWEVLVRPVVLPFLLVALVDGALTVYGTSSALGGSPTFSLAAGLVVGLGVLIILLSTFDIWGTWHPVLRESEFMTLLLRCLWAGGTSSWGLYELVGPNPLGSPPAMAEIARLGVIAVAGLVVSSSTIVVSFMTYNERRESASAA
jgi:hypothetical protein